MFWRIMHKEQAVILQTTIAHSLKDQRRLHWCISEHTCSAIKRLSIFMESPQEEIGMIAWKFQRYFCSRRAV